MKKIVLTALCLFLVACSSKAPRYLASAEPIVNIDSAVAQHINVATEQQSVSLSNLTDRLLALQYQITWYNSNGVTQLANWEQQPTWSCVTLPAKGQVKINFNKAIPESQNYRIYIMGK